MCPAKSFSHPHNIHTIHTLSFSSSYMHTQHECVYTGKVHALITAVLPLFVKCFYRLTLTLVSNLPAQMAVAWCASNSFVIVNHLPFCFERKGVTPKLYVFIAVVLFLITDASILIYPCHWYEMKWKIQACCNSMLISIWYHTKH